MNINLVSLQGRIQHALESCDFHTCVKLYETYPDGQIKAMSLNEVHKTFSQTCDRVLLNFHKAMLRLHAQKPNACLRHTSLRVSDYVEIGGLDRFWFLHAKSFFGIESQWRLLGSSSNNRVRTKCAGDSYITPAQIPVTRPEAAFLITCLQTLRPQRIVYDNVPPGDGRLPKIWNKVKTNTQGRAFNNIEFPVYHVTNGVTTDGLIHHLTPYTNRIRPSLDQIHDHNKLRRYMPGLMPQVLLQKPLAVVQEVKRRRIR